MYVKYLHAHACDTQSRISCMHMHLTTHDASFRFVWFHVDIPRESTELVAVDLLVACIVPFATSETTHKCKKIHNNENTYKKTTALASGASIFSKSFCQNTQLKLTFWNTYTSSFRFCLKQEKENYMIKDSMRKLGTVCYSLCNFGILGK